MEFVPPPIDIRGELKMSKTKIESLGWNQRFALIDHYNPTDVAICTAFGVTAGELQTARQMRTAGTFTPATDLDVEKYGNVFEGATIHTRPDADTKPETATKRVKEAKKRGRKGDKIQAAFTAIPAGPVSAQQFAKQHNVSLAVLRQSKRFDKTDLGTVRVKMDKNKALMIWREVK